MARGHLDGKRASQQNEAEQVIKTLRMLEGNRDRTQTLLAQQNRILSDKARVGAQKQQRATVLGPSHNSKKAK